MKILSAILLWATALTADQLEVSEMSFEGNKMLLSGHFKWEHPLGQIQGKSAEASFDNAENTKIPQEITMQEGMEITLQDGGILTAPYAWLGCRQWVGIFHGHEQKKITYEKTSDEVSLSSLRMEMNFVPPNSERLVQIEKLTADGLVEIGMKQNVRMAADRAVFDQFSSKGAFGMAHLFANEVPCTMTQMVEPGKYNTISAAQVEVDIRNQKTIFDNPEGELQREGAPLCFKAEKMIVDQKEERLVLEPPVLIDWLGHLESDGKVEIFRKNNQLRSVFIQGPAIISWNERRLEVFGTISIDPIDKKVLLTSPEDHMQNVIESAQVLFSDKKGKIYSDRAYLSFEDVDGHLKPLKMTFEGNVRLNNDTPGSLQYALADNALFDFVNNTLELQAKKRPRVLFFDELNKIQASAPGLLINRNPTNGQNVMHGLGNVRFVFAEDELIELKKRFSFEHKK